MKFPHAFLVLMIIANLGCDPPSNRQPIVPPGVELKPQLPEGAPEPSAIGETPLAATGARSGSLKVEPAAAEAAKAPLPENPIGDPVTLPSGLSYKVYKTGSGPEAKAGKRVTVHYTVSLQDGGRVVDSSRTKNQPYETPLTQPPVIQGWVEGIPGMKVGERRVFIIPPSLAYGQAGRDSVPPNATLVLDIELLAAEE